jgi:hypothetical protein
MAESIREQIVDAIITRFQNILKSKGYETDFGENTILWPTSPFSEIELPAICVFDMTEEITEMAMGRHQIWLGIQINLLSSSPDEVRKGIADISKAIGTDRTFGGLALGVEPPNNEMMVAEAEKIFSGAKINFRILFTTLAWDPYSQ